MTALTAIQFRAEPGNHPQEAHPQKCGLTGLTPGSNVNLERVFTSSAKVCRALFYGRVISVRPRPQGNERTDGNKAMVGRAALLIVEDNLRRRAAHLDLRAHLLNL